MKVSFAGPSNLLSHSLHECFMENDVTLSESAFSIAFVDLLVRILCCFPAEVMDSMDSLMPSGALSCALEWRLEEPEFNAI